MRTGEAPFTYQWSNGSANDRISVSDAGQYCVTVTDANGCSGQACGILTVRPALLVSVGDVTVCAGESGTLRAGISNGTAPFTYAWSTGATSDSTVVSTVKEMEKVGAGEIFLNSIDRDGTMEGYDIELIRKVAESASIPLIACGGAGKIEDFVEAVKKGGASAVAAGSMFVFHGKHRAVLITYSSSEELEKALIMDR